MFKEKSQNPYKKVEREGIPQGNKGMHFPLRGNKRITPLARGQGEGAEEETFCFCL